MNQCLAYELADYNEKLKAIAAHQIYNCAQIKEIFEGRRKEGRRSYAEMNKFDNL